MSEKDEMTIDERRKYLHKMWGLYRDSSKKEKGQMLDDMEHVTGLNRKSIIRILNGRLSRKKRTNERGPTYGTDVIDAARKISQVLDHPCAERLQPNLVFMAKHLRNHGQLFLDEKTLDGLESISISTLKRTLANINKSADKIGRKRFPKRKRNTFKEVYPMRRIPYDIPQPGHFEVDLVLHCDEDNAGEYIHTIQMIDVATGWCGIQAVFGRSYRVMRDGFERILTNLPIPVIEIHPDNGNEFFNQHLLRFWKNKIPDLDISRSRPYHKNDNRFVEENNGSLIRAYIGHGRLDTLQHLMILREIYTDLMCYHNFFQPVMKMIQKNYIDEVHYRRVFDTARPPLDRLAETNVVTKDNLEMLMYMRDQVDIVALRERLEKNITNLWHVKPKKDATSVNIFDTLRKEEDKASVTFSFEPTKPVR
ncbi:MAG: transposase family protein [ANME-2 cluster archaeon]|nr:transposase family protein [ANME-2 cluster archaeon]